MLSHHILTSSILKTQIVFSAVVYRTLKVAYDEYEPIVWVHVDPLEYRDYLNLQSLYFSLMVTKAELWCTLHVQVALSFFSKFLYFKLTLGKVHFPKCVWKSWIVTPYEVWTWGGKSCLAACPHLCNRNQGFSTANKHNVLKAALPLCCWWRTCF